MTRRRSATVLPVNRGPYVAVVGGVEHEYKTRSGAVTKLTDELDHWIRWARFYDHDSEERLHKVREQVTSATGSTDWEFDIAGLPGRCGLRVP